MLELADLVGGDRQPAFNKCVQWQIQGTGAILPAFANYGQIFVIA